MLYGSKTYLEAIWKNEKNYPVWLANYVDSTSYSGQYKIWQFSQTGTISGIKGKVDIDVMMWYPFGRGINISMSISDVEKKYNELKSKNFDFFLNLEVHSYKAEVEVYNDKE